MLKTAPPAIVFLACMAVGHFLSGSKALNSVVVGKFHVEFLMEVVPC